jgi:cytochrome P450
MGQLPTIDEYLRVKNKLLRWVRPTGDITRWTVKQIRSHLKNPDSSCPDFVTRFLQARDKYPEIMNEEQLEEYANTNVSAGSDTTAIILRSLVYEILVHPDAYTRFMAEIKAILKARPQDEHYNDPIRWSEGLKMPFFQACIKECLRYHPALGQLIPRDVPEGGVEIAGKLLPEGTVVGCNAWTVHRDKGLYGEDADEWRPDRWLDEDVEQVRRMENLSFAFGGGSRLCIGKNIAMLELTKFITEFFRRYEVELVDPKRWKLRPGWLVVQTGLDVRLNPRDQQSLLE